MGWWSGRVARAAKRFLAILLLCGTSSALASNVQFVGSVGYSSDYNTFTILVIDNVKNTSPTGVSANLRAELWASAAPFSGSFSSAYRMATTGIAPLAAGASTGKITATTGFTAPPGGLWYVAMVLTEYTGGTANDGYALRGYISFPDVIRIDGSSDTTPPTVSITSPTGGNVAGTVTVSATASDNVGVTHVDFYVNGALAVSDSTAPYQYSWNTTSAANGAAQLKAVAYDAAGNSTQSAIVTVNVANTDPTPPTVSITSPTGGNVAGTVTVSATASDNVGVTHVDFYVNGALAVSDSTAPYQYSWNTTSAANGAAQLKAVAYDAAGNSTQSAIVTVNVANTDPTPPTVSITSPTGGNVAGTVTVSATASDNVGVTHVDFYVNGALAVSDSTAPYQYSWNTTSAANGAAQLKAVAYDAAGNSTQSAIVTVNVANTDPTPPTVSITSPTGGNVAGTVTVSATASDNVGVTHVDFYVNGALAVSDSTAPYQYSWNTTSAANGAAQLKAVAYDAAGNSTQSAIVTVNVANTDPTPPTVSITSPTGGNVSGSVTVSVNASDNVGVTHVDLLVNGVLAGTDSSAPYQFAWNTTSLADGPAQLKAVAYDAAGNLAQSAIVTVNVANLTPNYQGLWWVSGGAESGWGINLVHQGDQVFATWYTYDASGKPWWLSMLANRISPTSETYAGAIYVDHGPPFSSYVGSGTPAQVGNGTLTFSDDSNAVFGYTVSGVSQSKTISRFDLGTGPQVSCIYSVSPDLASATNYQDLWWMPGGSESGWGVNIAHQGDTLFATWYSYDLDGTPLWLSGLMQRVGATNTYAGALLRTSGPRFDAYRSVDLIPAQTIGSATFTFADGNDATFTYTVQLAGMGDPMTQHKPLTRFPFGPTAATVCR